ncbi:MAG: PAS domain S-box protein [Leptolyngbyaceae cyanobacterium SM2_3_12]|nr:PAS domain S-box protein [Leptolyngbyaceae cyanobacterium SM2_3_12]
MTQIIETLEASISGIQGSILLLENNRLWHGATPSLPQSYVEAVNGVTIGPTVGSCGTAAYLQEPVISSHIATDPLWQDFAEIAQQYNFHACWSFPIFSQTGEVLGSFGLYRQQSGEPSAADLAVIATAVHLAGVAIERKQTEAALQDNRDFLQTILDNLPVSLFVKDATPERFGQYVLVNQVCERFFGYPRARIVDHTAQDLFDTDQANHFDQKDQQVLTDGGKVVYEQTLARPHLGESRPQVLQTTKVALQGADGQPRYVLGISEDITERKAAELALAASERRYMVLAESSPVGVFQTDAQGNCEYINPKWCQIAGLTTEEVLGPNWAKALHPKDRERVAAAWYEAVQQNQGFMVECRFQQPSGQVSWILAQATALADEADQLIGYIGTITDITERKRLEEDLQQSEANLNNILDSLGAGVSRVRVYENNDWKMEYLSKGFGKLYGYSADELIANKNLWSASVSSDHWETVMLPTFPKVFQGEAYQIEYQFQRPDGTQCWISQNCNPQRDEENTSWVVTSVAVDITEQKQTQAALRNQEMQLQELALASPAVMFTLVNRTDGSSTFEYISPAVETVHGVSTAAAYEDALTVLGQMHPEDIQSYQQVLTDSVSLMELVPYECRFITATGQVKWLQLQSTPSRRESGELVWRGIAIDITALKQAELALQQSEAKFRALFNSAFHLLGYWPLMEHF